MHSIFDPAGVEVFAARIESLRPESSPLWGKMNAAQMLAHNSLIFEGARFDTYPTVNPVMRFLVGKMLRGYVIGDRPYRRNTKTVPVWVVSDPRDLEKERARILENLHAVRELGASHFEGKRNPTFGVLTAAEWSRLFCKHLDHHLLQFGV